MSLHVSLVFLLRITNDNFGQIINIDRFVENNSVVIGYKKKLLSPKPTNPIWRTAAMLENISSAITPRWFVRFALKCKIRLQ